MYDSHPSPAERFALVHRLQGAPDPADDGALALSLLDDCDALQRAMTREICGRVSEQTGIHIPDEEAPPRRRPKPSDAAEQEEEAAEETA